MKRGLAIAPDGCVWESYGRGHWNRCYHGEAACVMALVWRYSR